MGKIRENLSLFLIVGLIATTQSTIAVCLDSVYQEVRILTGTDINMGLGSEVEFVGDVNNDNYADYAIYSPAGGGRADSVVIYSGLDGSFLRQHSGGIYTGAFGSSIDGLGDLNSDGHDDYIIGAFLNDFAAPDAGSAFVFSGIDGSLLLPRFDGTNAGDQFGNVVGRAGFVDGDVIQDFFVAARYENAGGNDRGNVHVYSGATGVDIYTASGPVDDAAFGDACGYAGDVNNDGRGDLIIAYRGFNGTRGKVLVYSGMTHDTIPGRVWDGQGIGEFLANTCGTAGDVNNDGFDDIIYGTFYQDNGGALGDNYGKVYIRSGQTGNIIHEILGSFQQLLGAKATGIGDMNRDGFDDIAISSNGGAGSFAIYSGRTGTEQIRINGELPDDNMDIFATGGDFNGDGIVDVITSGYRHDVGANVDAGRVYIYSFCDSDGDSIPNFFDPFTVTQSADSADVFFLERADLDRDNRADFVFTGTVDDSLYVAYGKPDGTLQVPQALASIQRAAITIDYLDGDTLLDIIARSATQLFVLQNNGNRTFTTTSQPLARMSDQTDISASFPSVASGYFNADAQLDVIASSGRLLFGDGNGSFFTTLTLPFVFDDVDVADLNGDYIDDIVVTRSDSAIHYLNDGSGFFTASASYRISPFAVDYSRIKTNIDLNADGIIDIVAVAGNSSGANDTSKITISLGDGSGGVSSSSTLTSIGRGLNFTVNDVDRDNFLDISLVTADTRDLIFYRGTGLGQFVLEAILDLGQSTGPVYGIADADLNRDGNIDIVAGGTQGSGIALATSQAVADSIFSEEMVVTGLGDEFVRISDPNGLRISDKLRTVAGSAYGRVDVDNDGTIDDRAFNYNLQEGTYEIVAGFRPAPVGPVRSIDVGIGINGFNSRVVAKGYTGTGSNPGDTMSFPFSYPDKTAPGSGVPVSAIQPILTWEPGYVARSSHAVSYRYQLSRYHDFRTTILDTSGLQTAEFEMPFVMSDDSVYYWRVSADGGEFSLASALYVVNGACGKSKAGNADCDTLESVDIADLTILVDHLFISFTPLCCASEGNCDGNPGVDIGDLTALVDHLFISFAPLANCQ